MLNYLRYTIALILLSGLFYSFQINISEETITKSIDKKIPLFISKKGFDVNITELLIEDVSEDNIVSSVILGNVKVNKKNKSLKNIEQSESMFSKFLKKSKIIDKISNTAIDFKINSKAIPVLHGSKLSFKVKELDINNNSKFKILKGTIIKRLEKITVPIKQLEKYSFFLSVKNIAFNIDKSLTIDMKANPFLLFFLIFLFLLRESGLLAIMFYQKFLSPRKNYTCAKNHVHQNGTCSNTTKEAFKNKGFVGGMKEYRKSTKECKEAYSTIQNRSKEGACDAAVCAGCDGLEASSMIGETSSACELGDCGAGGCEIGSC